MDGSNEQLFINNTSISDENLLMAVDESSERLYRLKGNHVFSVHLRKNDSNVSFTIILYNSIPL